MLSECLYPLLHIFYYISYSYEIFYIFTFILFIYIFNFYFLNKYKKKILYINGMDRKLYENIMHNVSKEVKKALNEISDEALLMAAGAAKHKANNASSEEERNYEMKRYNNFLNYAHNSNRYVNSGNADPISILRRLGELANANGNENAIKQKNPNDELPDDVTPEKLIVYAMKYHQKIQV